MESLCQLSMGEREQRRYGEMVQRRYREMEKIIF